MIIDQKLLDELSAQAKANPRLRQNYDLRTSPADNSLRMLNALEPETVIPIHRHMKSSETICMIRGKMVMKLYDEKGTITDEFVMEPCGEHPMVQVEVGQWHSLEVMEEETMVFEAKDGMYETLTGEDYIACYDQYVNKNVGVYP